MYDFDEQLDLGGDPLSFKVVNPLKFLRRCKSQCDIQLPQSSAEELHGLEDSGPKRPTDDTCKILRDEDENCDDDANILHSELEDELPRGKRVRWDDNEVCGWEVYAPNGVPQQRRKSDEKDVPVRPQKKKSPCPSPPQKTSIIRLFQGKFQDHLK